MLLPQEIEVCSGQQLMKLTYQELQCLLREVSRHIAYEVDVLPTELLRQLNWLRQIKTIQARVTTLTKFDKRV